MQKFKKLTIILLGVCISLFIAYQVSVKYEENNTVKISPIPKKLSEIYKETNPFKLDQTNILLIGTDISDIRRSKGQYGFNTDTMILVSINPNTNRVLLTSVPRDLWINNGKINSLYTLYGEKILIDAFEKITGQEVDGTIMADFDDFAWIVDSFGGVPVDVQRTFSDYNFPTEYGGVNPVTFEKGIEIMDGERALTFARSRKGNNGEGSDLMRAKRQHLILEGFIKAVNQPESIFWPMDIEYFYKTVTAPQKMSTTLSLNNATLLWDLYKDKDKYTIESFVVDGGYVYHPGMYPQSSYHAWVFVPRDEGFEQLHNDIKSKLEYTTVSGAQTDSKQSKLNQEI